MRDVCVSCKGGSLTTHEQVTDVNSPSLSLRSVAELDLLLTSGRLSSHNRAVIEGAYVDGCAGAIDAGDYGGAAADVALKTAEQLFFMTPEVCSFVRSFVRAFVRSFVHSFVRSFVRSLVAHA